MTQRNHEHLPIHDHVDEIVELIERDRVVIIHGETGCGKSSGLPQILLDRASAVGKKCKMMISQPRRIAASSLMKRLRTTLGNLVGMRMGFGVKDEDATTMIHFVTTGYLVRLAAHHPTAFRNHTHLIIDEVHERSVDSDLLCYFAKKLLNEYPQLKVILMSATIHIEMFKQYFREYSYHGIEFLSVGLRRFPLQTFYVEDIAGMKGHKKGKTDISKCFPRNIDGAITADMIKKQYDLAFTIVTNLVEVGTGVLIFVAGIDGINTINEKFEGLPGFKIYSIHSEIPFEEQEAAFLPAPSDQVKVVVATNAAESSITLPDVDVVICLGMHKSLSYDERQHRVSLNQKWISKASSTQRAGRTGRVRPGTVFRIYPKQLYESFKEFDDSQIQTTPLHDIILDLRNMLENSIGFNGVRPILENLLEPPDTINILNSFDYLYDNQMITAPDDYGNLTKLGSLVSKLPVDCMLGKLISLGIKFGCAPECVIIASALVQQKKLFRIGSPYIHKDPDELNEIVRGSTEGAFAMDNGAYSEPIMHVNLLCKWLKQPEGARWSWCQKHNLVYSRVKAFAASTQHLLRALNSYAFPDNQLHSRNRSKETVSFNDITLPLSAEKLNLLRLILVWTFDENLLYSKVKQVDANKTRLVGPTLSKQCFASVFGKNSNWDLSIAQLAVFAGEVQRGTRTDRDILSSTIKSTGLPIVWLISPNPEGLASVVLAVNKAAGEIVKQFMDEMRLSFPYAKELDAIVASNSVIYSLFYSETISKLASKALKAAFTSYQNLAYLHIQINDQAELHINGAKPAMNLVENIFWGSDPSDTIKKKIKERVLGCEQYLEFTDPKEISHRNQLIVNVSLEMRLLTACVMTFKIPELRTKLPEYYTGDSFKQLVDNTGKRLIPGTKEYVEQKALIRMTDDLENVASLQPKSETTSWKAEKYGSVRNKSYLTGCCHCIPEVTFAVAADIIAVKLMDRLIYMASAITLLPVGIKWLTLAVKCAGREHLQRFWESRGENTEAIAASYDFNMSISSKLTADDNDNCEKIADVIEHIGDDEVQLMPHMIATVRELFKEWIDPIDGPGSKRQQVTTHGSGHSKRNDVAVEKVAESSNAMDGFEDDILNGWGGMDWYQETDEGNVEAESAIAKVTTEKSVTNSKIVKPVTNPSMVPVSVLTKQARKTNALAAAGAGSQRLAQPKTTISSTTTVVVGHDTITAQVPTVATAAQVASNNPLPKTKPKPKPVLSRENSDDDFEFNQARKLLEEFNRMSISTCSPVCIPVAGNTAVPHFPGASIRSFTESKDGLGSNTITVNESTVICKYCQKEQKKISKFRLHMHRLSHLSICIKCEKYLSGPEECANHLIQKHHLLLTTENWSEHFRAGIPCPFCGILHQSHAMLLNHYDKCAKRNKMATNALQQDAGSIAIATRSIPAVETRANINQTKKAVSVVPTGTESAVDQISKKQKKEKKVKLVCVVCNNQFNSERLLEKHMLKKHL